MWDLPAFGRSKGARYSVGSVIAWGTSEVVLVLLLGPAGWTAVSASVAACVAGGVPSYYLNRRWVWRRSGRGHLWREVMPFWVLAFAGLVLSTWWARLAEGWALEHVASRVLQIALIVTAATSAALALWVVKFVIFDRLMFGRDP